MSDDGEKVMLYGLQSYAFCKRQFALEFIEQQEQVNWHVANGRMFHERVDHAGSETRKDVHVATALRLTSEKFGLAGVADAVEFHRIGDEHSNGKKVGVRLPKREGWWRPYPVEYKRGKPKAHRADEVQLCAQAMCLEEMLGVVIPEGALFYGEPRRRTVVAFDDELRALTESVARDAHALIRSGVTPPPVRTKACEACSLKEFCFEVAPSAKAWIAGQIDEIAEGMA